MDDSTVPGGSEDLLASLTSGAVARLLGVAPTTLRSWDRRYGLGPAERAQGQHRRWSPRDVAMLEYMCRLTSSGIPPAEAARLVKHRRHAAEGRQDKHGRHAADDQVDTEWAVGVGGPQRHSAPRPVPPVPPAPDLRREGRGLARAALRLDADEVEDRLNTLVGAIGLIPAWEEVMVPTLRAAGRKWELSDDRYVEVEHLLSWHVSTTLRGASLLAPRTGPPPHPGPVVLACAPGEQHTLPLEALNAALRQSGVPTRMLGGCVPADALAACVRRTGPAAVVLWSQS
ncbi:MerR family transcriptional regulator, partial [Streptomyces flavofungini]|uniref:MerR family transcriptional regulator n=1 Tax=Streptomyces flavofungini TaxID=68200 RepID=UPI0034DF0655